MAQVSVSDAPGTPPSGRRGLPFHLKHVDKDKEGRYVLVRGFLADEAVTMLSIYGPNQDDPNFFVNLFISITCPPTELIIGGDFNLVLDPAKDRSSPTSKS